MNTSSRIKREQKIESIYAIIHKFYLFEIKLKLYLLLQCFQVKQLIQWILSLMMISKKVEKIFGKTKHFFNLSKSERRNARNKIENRYYKYVFMIN